MNDEDKKMIKEAEEPCWAVLDRGGNSALLLKLAARLRFVLQKYEGTYPESAQKLVEQAASYAGDPGPYGACDDEFERLIRELGGHLRATLSELAEVTKERDAARDAKAKFLDLSADAVEELTTKLLNATKERDDLGNRFQCANDLLAEEGLGPC